MHRLVRLLALTLTPVLVASCAVMRTVPRGEIVDSPRDPAGSFARFATPSGQRISGYTTTDGRFHKFVGHALLMGDSVEFRGVKTARGWPLEREPGATIRVAITDLDSVRGSRIEPARTMLAVVLAAGLGWLAEEARCRTIQNPSW